MAHDEQPRPDVDNLRWLRTEQFVEEIEKGNADPARVKEVIGRYHADMVGLDILEEQASDQ